MGWTAPAAIGTDWAVGEIVLAGKLNSHVADNLRYLKGLDGAVAIQNALAATAGAASQDILLALSGAAGNYAGIAVGRTAGEGRLVVPGAANQFFVGSAAGDVVIQQADPTKKILIGATGPVLNVVGANVGIGTLGPAGPLHAVGAGGNVLFLSANAVDGTLQTLAPAGTVTQGSLFIVFDRNNTSPFACYTTTFTQLINFTTPYVTATDTLQIVTTAGGAITVQRTVGTNGTHQVNLLVLFK